MQGQKMLLNEDSLQSGDLKNLVKHVFEVDNYASKMGDDKDIVVLSFTVEHKSPAEDLVSFIEKGYQFVLDADITPGELSDGKYRVFVEMQRTPKVAEQIVDMLYGVGKLADIDKFKFRYHKSFNSQDAVIETLNTVIPSDPSAYEQSIMENKLLSYDTFFSKSMLDSVNVSDDDILEVKKIYADPLRFRVVAQGNKAQVLEGISEKVNVNEWAEIIFLCKYFGDYNITKFGNKLVFENDGQAIVLERL
jgi:hypothetical protein